MNLLRKMIEALCHYLKFLWRWTSFTLRWSFVPSFETQKFEIWEFPESGPRFQHTMVYLITTDEVRNLCIQKWESQISWGDLDWHSAQILPPEHLWPPAPPNFQKFLGEIETDVYVKRPGLGNYTILREMSVTPADLLLQEATIFEHHFQLKHVENIVEYLGYLAGPGDLIRGLCFRKYKETLQDRLEDVTRPINTNAIIFELEKALNTLHTMGLVHNDLHAGNIMIDENENPIIIDFDSCVPDGMPLGVKPGVDLTKTVSSYSNDRQALQNLKVQLTSTSNT